MPMRTSDAREHVTDSCTSQNGAGEMLGDEDIVISGISGRLPESESIEEFKTKLYEQVDMVTDDERRWPSGILGLPLRTGKLKHLKYFDAPFFGVHAKQAHVMDPQLRLILESVYEAIIDAGVNPVTVRGSKTGVFTGVTASESGEFWNRDTSRENRYNIIGCSLSMFANRISYTFDFKGPSYAVDSACSSSLLSLQHAVNAIRTGQCDAAIVAGTSLLLNPSYSLNFHKMRMLSPDGMCKSFDASGNGFVRSEAVMVLYVQKATVAKRVYATLVNAKTNNDGAKERGITFPSGQSQKRLIEEVYREVNINPTDVTYVEAHGTGTKVGDPQELNAIVDVFCNGRRSPLFVGSVKSNMGHAEAASGLCSIAKVIIGMENELIPANLHFKTPNKEIAGLHDGRLQVIDQPWPFKGGLVAINSMGFGGSNAHILLRSNPKLKQPAIEDGIPRLVCVSGRTENAVRNMLNKIINAPRDNDLVALLHNIHDHNIPGHTTRGFTVLGDATPSIQLSSFEEHRPTWFIFPGMGCQWTGMIKSLMKFEQFAITVRKAAVILKSVGFELHAILECEDDSIFENIINRLVSIIVCEVALVDLLKSLGIEPDGMIGHSLGEIGCAYADGAFTCEQAVMTAYWRARRTKESKVPEGAMAYVGLSAEEAQRRVPDDVVVACDNGVGHVIISGPAKSVSMFCQQLSAEGVLTQRLNSCGMAFHSKYVAEIGTKLLEDLNEIIPSPKPRSSKWISSSIPESEWGSPVAQLSSGAYQVHNFVSPVLFRKALEHIPQNAIVIEIAPHGLFNSVLKQTLRPSTTVLRLMDKEHPNNMKFLLDNLGEYYNAGGQPKLSRLFCPVKFPVAKGTPMLQSMVEWDHSVEWKVAHFSDVATGNANTIEIDPGKKEHAFYLDHRIDRQAVFPATGYLMLVWQTLANMERKPYDELPVVIENVQLLRAVIMPKNSVLKFEISILPGTGEFEICELGSVVAKGYIRVAERILEEFLDLPPPDVPEDSLLLTSSDVYKELRLRGYDYAGIFQGIMSSDARGISGKLRYVGNFVSFIDTMLQLALLRTTSRGLYLPTRLRRVVVDPLKQKKLFESLSDGVFPVYDHPDVGVVSSGGVEVRGVETVLTHRHQQFGEKPVLQKHVFVPFENERPVPEFGLQEALITVLGLIIENNAGMSKLEILEAGGASVESLYASTIIDIVRLEPILIVDYTVATTIPIVADAAEELGCKVIAKNIADGPIKSNTRLAIAANTADDRRMLVNLASSVQVGGFVLSVEDVALKTTFVDDAGMVLIMKLRTPMKVVFLFRKVGELPTLNVVNLKTDSFDWVDEVKMALVKSRSKNDMVLVVAQEETNGVLGFVNCLRKEPGGAKLRVVFIMDHHIAPFSITAPFYAIQLKKDLIFNIVKDSVWGSYRHLPFESGPRKALPAVEHAYLNSLLLGDMASIRWFESPLTYYKPENYPGSSLCYVYYASLNFKDVMLASGRLFPDLLNHYLDGQGAVLGFEFSGRDSTGRKVMGMVGARGLATTVLSDPCFLWEVPANWTLEQAASVPVVYSTAYYALVIRGRMKRGETLLVHAGAGGVGQAAITIAFGMGCTVYTTVGSHGKREFLKKRFPKLTDAHIASSRDASFEQHVLMQTKGKGVDLVLNSLAEEMLQASVRCLGRNGRFLEIGKFDVSNNTSLGMSVLSKNTTFHGIFLDTLFDAEADNSDKKAIVQLVADGLKNGDVKPLPTTVFSDDQVERAFRFMATGAHIGKIVIKVRDEESMNVTQPARRLVNAIPRTYMDPDKSYVLVGGLGGFGLEFAIWLARRGARKLVLTSHNGIKSSYQLMCKRRLEENGVDVRIAAIDCTTVVGTEWLLKEAGSMGPVGGIFNLAAIVRDALFENLTPADFELVCEPKVIITKNLDIVSRRMCPSLNYFVFFSAMACSVGNIGQTHYGFANSVAERICERRQAAGLPAMAIQWGPIGDVGVLMDLRGVEDIVVIGTRSQRIASCLAVVDTFLQQPDAVLSSFVLAEKCNQADSEANSASIVDVIANILGIKNSRSMNPSSTLAEYGVDSLMNAEIRQTLKRNFNLSVAASEVGTLTKDKLLELQLAAGATAASQ